MINKIFRSVFAFVFIAMVSVFGLMSQLDASAQGANPFDTGGRDDKPAGEVFKNIQALKNMPAGRLAAVMTGWTRALGVKCNHCHTLGAWEKDDMPTKQIARDMIALASKINGESLKQIKNLKSEKPSISCYTCHRGALKPETAPPPTPEAAPPR
jgi:photosynthetic reaction center cytochrome c subunit